VDPSRISNLDNPQHRELAREVSRQSITLLKNENGLLPLNPKSIRNIAVIGPLGDDPNDQVGGYTQYGAHIVSPLEGIVTYSDSRNLGWNVGYAQGCFVMNNSDALIHDAVDLATQSDIAFVVVGDNGDTCQESWGGRSGDRTSLDLAGGQLNLIESILATGTKTIVVLINGRPATFGAESQNVLLNDIQALLVSWRPGEEGGTAIAEIIFGDVVPSGKLISTWPFSVGQIGGPSQPYYQKYRQYDGRRYTFQTSSPLFPFGFGLSYTQYNYSNLSVKPSTITQQEAVKIQALITNIGNRKGTEIVQLYVADPLASVVRYSRQLIGFKRMTLNPGQSQTVTFVLHGEQLAFYNNEMKYVVEPGQFNVCVSSSSEGGLEGSFFVSS